MSNWPSFRFYPDNFLGGTALMTNEEVGIYMRILCHLFNHGPLKKEQIERITYQNIPNIILEKLVKIIHKPILF